jgi:hypothetical protein
MKLTRDQLGAWGTNIADANYARNSQKLPLPDVFPVEAPEGIQAHLVWTGANKKAGFELPHYELDIEEL